MRPSALKQNLPILAATMVALFSGYLLFFGGDELSFSDSSSEIIAVLNERTNKVKRKPSNALGWKETTVGERFFDQDEVFTDSVSNAGLNFSDGTKLTLGPNSLVRIERKDKDTSIQVKRGFIFAEVAAAQSNFKLSIGDKQVAPSRAKTTRLQVQVDSTTQQSEISIKEGEATLKSNNAQTKDVELSPQVKATFDEKKDEVAVVKQTLALTKPRDNSRNVVSKGEALEFDWTTSETTVKRYELVIARDPWFKNITMKRKAEPKGTRIADLAEGTYYWKIVALDEASNPVEESSQSVFSISPPVPVVLVRPQNNETWRLDSARDRVKANFDWERSPEATDYRFELASDASFRTMVFEQKLEHTSVAVDGLSGGRYFWRVRTTDTNGRTTSSEVRSLFINAPTRLVSLVAPSNGDEFAFEDAFEGIIFRINTPHDKTHTNVVEVSTSAQFETLFTSVRTSETSAVVKDLEAGAYYWRVRVLNASQKVIETSPTSEFVIRAPKQLAPPKLQREYKFQHQDDGSGFRIDKLLRYAIAPFVFETAYAASKKSFALDWPAVEEARAYVFELSASPNFENVLKKQVVSEPRIELEPLAPGAYYFRIAAVSRANKQGPFSEASRISILGTASRLVSPPQDFQTKTETVEDVAFEWTKPRGAIAFTFELANDAQFEKKSEATRSDKTLLKRKLSPGSYFWRVIAHFNGVPSVTSAPRSLRIAFIPPPTPTPTPVPTPPPKPVAPLSVLPANALQIGNQSPQPTVFEWKAGDTLSKEFELQIATDNAFKKLSHTQKTSKESVSAPLKDGQYVWRVRAFSLEGVASDWSESRSLNIKTFRPPPPKTTSKQKSAGRRLLPRLVYGPRVHAGYARSALKSLGSTAGNVDMEGALFLGAGADARYLFYNYDLGGVAVFGGASFSRYLQLADNAWDVYLALGNEFLPLGIFSLSAGFGTSYARFLKLGPYVTGLFSEEVAEVTTARGTALGADLHFETRVLERYIFNLRATYFVRNQLFVSGQTFTYAQSYELDAKFGYRGIVLPNVGAFLGGKTFTGKVKPNGESSLSTAYFAVDTLF